MGEKGRSVARIEDIPSSGQTPGSTLTEEEEEEALRARPGGLRAFREIRRALPVVRPPKPRDPPLPGHHVLRVNAFEVPAGNPLVIPHDETAYGQEEIYLVLRGRARFACDGEELELGEGELLYARPEVHREGMALETPTLLFLVGGLLGKAYEIPTWSRDWKRPTPAS